MESVDGGTHLADDPSRATQHSGIQTQPPYGSIRRQHMTGRAISPVATVTRRKPIAPLSRRGHAGLPALQSTEGA